ncbi:hypothetical protein SB781_03440 [Paraburkholderia sp. SIMBA_061]
MTDLQRTIDADPYRVVINLQKEFDPAVSDKVIGYRASGIISRLDGKPVHKTFVRYTIPQGDVIADRADAMREGEGRARAAINGGFPD